MKQLLWMALISSLISHPLFAQKIFPIDISARLKDHDKDGVIEARDKCANTPAWARVDNEGCAITKHNTQSIESKVELDVHFDSNQYKLKDTELKNLLKLGKFLQTYQTTDVIIEGHTDSSGDLKQNQTLSQNRADAIKQALIEKFKITPSRIKAIGYGETHPLADNDTQSGRAANRRVTAEVTYFGYQSSHPIEKRWTIYTPETSAFNQQNL